MLYTSLSTIKSFNPCVSGWRNILEGQNKIEADDILFPITEAVESNSISDVCWLLGKMQRKNELVNFARACADSVRHLDNHWSRSAAAAADAAIAYAYVVAAVATAVAIAADAAVDAAVDAAIQRQKDKQLLIDILAAAE